MEKTRERPIRVDRVAELLDCTRSYVYKLVHWKKIPFRKPNNGRLFFYESEILDFIERSRHAADYEVSEQASAILNREAK
jgi:excisionase family DNA binding protein